jgi:hypothetical protein
LAAQWIWARRGPAPPLQPALPQLR